MKSALFKIDLGVVNNGYTRNVKGFQYQQNSALVIHTWPIVESVGIQIMSLYVISGLACFRK